MRRCHSLTLVSWALSWSGFLVINYHLVSVYLHTCTRGIAHRKERAKRGNGPADKRNRNFKSFDNQCILLHPTTDNTNECLEDARQNLGK